MIKNLLIILIFCLTFIKCFNDIAGVPDDDENLQGLYCYIFYDRYNRGVKSQDQELISSSISYLYICINYKKIDDDNNN